MPIIEIRSLPPADKERIGPMLREACTDGAKAFGCPAGNVWATFEEVRPGWYAEGDTVAGAPGEGTHPPLVLVRALKGRTPEMKKAFLDAVSRAIGRGLGIPPGNVWIHMLEMERSDVWMNGAFHG
jgi:phenylpyruvate tautomerase PptA (4-oxalocrotonate tautomerase family)